jgi:hypothetical protein
MMKKAFLFFFSLSFSFITLAQNDTLRFAVAGHGYGAHAGSNLGLHPPFLDAMDRVPDRHEFLILTGDLVRDSNTQSWDAVENELSIRDITSYYVRGNHDKNSPAVSVFVEKHGGNFYSFKKDSVLFVVLNSSQARGTISIDQVTFLANTLQDEADSVSHVLVLFHFLLWNGDIKYEDIKSNLGSQYSYLYQTANYWSDIHPILEIYNDKQIFVVAGDLGGRSYSIPAYYEKIGHISLVANGMGEIADENYLEWTMANNKMDICVIPLDPNLPKKNIKDYQYFISSIDGLTPPHSTIKITQNETGIFIHSALEMTVNVLDISGKKVLSQKVNAFEFINTEHLKTGVHIMQFKSESEISFQKVFIP